MSDDFYCPGKDLSRRGLLQIALEEAYRDGNYSQEERQTIQYLRKAFKLTDRDYRAVKARLKVKYEAGELKGSGEMDPIVVYRRAIELAFADGKVSGKEKKYLKILGKVLWITPEEHVRVIREIRSVGDASGEMLAVPDRGSASNGSVAPPRPPQPPPAVAAAPEQPAAPPPPGPPVKLPRPPAPPPAAVAAAPVPPIAAPAAAPPVKPGPKASPPAAPAPGPETRPTPLTPPAADTPPEGRRPSGSSQPVRTRPSGAHAKPPVKTAETLQTAAVHPPVISKPVLLGGLGALGAVLLLFGAQQLMLSMSDEPVVEPKKPVEVKVLAPPEDPAGAKPSKRPRPSKEPVAQEAPKPPGPNPEAEKFFSEGIQLLQGGRLDEAIAAYQKGIEVEDKQAYVHNNLGHAYERKGNDDAAIREYQRAIQIDPSYPLAYNNLGTVYERKGRTAEAMALYQKSIELKPDYANALYNLGVLYGRSRRYDEAIDVFRKVVDLRPKDPYAHKDLWLAYSRKGLEKEAKAELEIARSLGLRIGE